MTCGSYIDSLTKILFKCISSFALDQKEQDKTFENLKKKNSLHWPKQIFQYIAKHNKNSIVTQEIRHYYFL